MKNILIILGLAFAGYYIYKMLSKEKKTNRRVQIQDAPHPLLILKQDEKEQILSRLNEVKDEYLKDLVNCEITFLARTELEDYGFAEKIYQKFPKKLSRPTIDISPLYKEFDIKLVDKSIEEMLESFGAKDFESELNQPFLRFEYYIQKEAKETARMLFDDFLNQMPIS